MSDLIKTLRRVCSACCWHEENRSLVGSKCTPKCPDCIERWAASNEIELLEKKLECIQTSESAELFSKKQELVRLRAYVQNDAKCPCCNEVKKCVDGCTYEEDVGTNSEYFQRMIAAREVLWPGDCDDFD